VRTTPFGPDLILSTARCLPPTQPGATRRWLRSAVAGIPAVGTNDGYPLPGYFAVLLRARSAGGAVYILAACGG
jgi:hypothetical protein